MLRIESEREHSRKKVLLQNYYMGKRIWEMEHNFNEAIKHNDPEQAGYYDREIKKIYERFNRIEG